MKEEHVLLFLVPHVVMRRIRKYGGEVEWLEAKKTYHHYYTVRVRTRPVKREMRTRSREQVAVDREFKKTGRRTE